MSERLARADSFPRQQARTRNFSLGLPRSFTVAADGSRVVFLRAPAGDDPATALWVFDTAQAVERLVADPRALGREGVDTPEAERARRERAREQAEGIVAYSTDREARVAAFALGGGLWVTDLIESEVRRLPATEPVFDPHVDPTGRRIAYVATGALRVIDLDGRNDRLLAEDPDPDVSWGLAEFAAAEEMDRRRGFWWSPDGERVAATRVDERPVQVWHLFDPVEPASSPLPRRYPAAGTPNSGVTLHVLALDGGRHEVTWDRTWFEYLARVVWSEGAPLTLLVQSRDQRTAQILTANQDGTTSVAREDRDPAWVDLVEGAPRWLPDGGLVSTADLDDTKRLLAGGDPVTPPGLHVRRVLHVEDDVLFTASSEDPMEVHVWRWSPRDGVERLTDVPGVHEAATGGDALVVVSATIEAERVATVHRKGRAVATLVSHTEGPLVDPRPRLFLAGPRQLRAALLLPGGEEPGEPLPVLLDPYGGPKYQRVVRSRERFLESQWFADQGFAVLVADGRGTPGRGAAWERAVAGDLAGPPLEDQVDALHAAADRFGFLDLSRVAIRGWSFGGYLAALAALRRPDVFHAAVAGAPVTEWRLYDTHYTERYLGLPDDAPETYRKNSLLDDAATLSRPLLIIHGMTDDNVLVAHSLRLSRALLEAGRPHTFLPLSGITHMTTQEAVAENLLLLQLEFLQRALGLG